MDGTTTLRASGQRLWLDTISRRLLDSGTLQHYVDAYGITGVTSNPTILSREMTADTREFGPPQDQSVEGNPEVLVTEEAIHDVQRAADLFRPMWENTQGDDGWVSIEVQPHVAYRVSATVREGRRLATQVGRPNVFIKVPATWPGVAAIEELTVSGVPTNATLVFDTRQHQAVTNGYLRGLERRRRMGLSVSVASVASVFVSRWDAATNPLLPEKAHNLMGLRVAHAIDRQHRDTIASARWTSLDHAGAIPQRLVWASTSPKDPNLEPTYYARRLPLDGTINTMPESTLLALAHTADLPLIDSAEFARALASAELIPEELELARTLRREGVQRFVDDWDRLLATHQRRDRAS